MKDDSLLVNNNNFSCQVLESPWGAEQPSKCNFSLTLSQSYHSKFTKKWVNNHNQRDNKNGSDLIMPVGSGDGIFFSRDIFF